MKLNPRQARLRRHARVRAKVKGTADRPRLCVFRSLSNVSTQVIDDSRGHTLAAASTLEAGARSETGEGGKVAAASHVGKLIAQRALAKGINQVVFDRGGYKYHGRVKALAEAAREAGLKF